MSKACPEQLVLVAARPLPWPEIVRRLVVAAIAVLAWTVRPACAADLFASGDQASRLCDENQAWCVGFVTGALDGWAALEAYYTGDKFCIPSDLPVGQIVETFRTELARRPEPRDDPAAYILYEGLLALYPCGADRELDPPALPGPEETEIP